MRIPHFLGIALLVSGVSAGLLSSSAMAIKYSDSAADSGFVQRNQSDDDSRKGESDATPGRRDDRNESDDKDDKARSESKERDDKDKREAKDKDEKNSRSENDKSKGDDKEDQKGRNSGVIFVKAGQTVGPGNDSHVGCDFYVFGMNFPGTAGTIAFYAWKPTGSFQLVSPLTGSPVFDPSAPANQRGNRNSDFLNGPYRLPTDGQTALAKQGYHYKVEASNADGKKVSSKVFWSDCPLAGAGGVPSANVTASPGEATHVVGTPTDRVGATVTASASQSATVTSGPVTIVMTMSVSVTGPNGSINIPAGTTITVPAGTTLIWLPSAPVPATQFVEVDRGTAFGTAAFGVVTSDEEAFGEVVLGGAASRATPVPSTDQFFVIRQGAATFWGAITRTASAILFRFGIA